MDNFINKLMFFIAPTNDLEESTLEKNRWLQIWYGVFSNIMCGIFTYSNMKNYVKRRINQSFLVSNYVVAFYDEELKDVVFAPCYPSGERNSWNEYTRYNMILPDGKERVLKRDSDKFVIGYNYDVPTINDNLICWQFATTISEIKLSIDNSIILSRFSHLIEVENENQVNEILDFISDQRIGKPFTIAKKRVGTEHKTTNIAPPTSIIDYYDGLRDVLNEFLTVTGLSSLVNPNKKERMITTEITSNEDIKNTLLSNRIENRENFFNEVNEMFGTDYKCEIDEKIYSTVESLTAITNNDNNDEGGDSYDD